MRTGIALGCILLLALVMRALGFEWVFVDGDTVVFAPGDAQYHVRRTLYAWTNFPVVLFADPYINYPGGAAISWPPLFDFAVAGVARVLTADAHRFEVALAWAPTVFGALTILPVFALARRIGGNALALGAAALLALLPMSITYSRVGQFDHHCAVALIGACALWCVSRLVAGDGSSRWLGAALAAVRIAMLLTWHGSLLYLVLIESILWTAAAMTGRRDLCLVQALSALATFVVIAPLVWLFPEPLGGAYSAIALSRLHVLAVAAVVLVSAGCWWLEGRDPARTPRQRLVSTALLGGGVAIGLGLLPGTREGLEPALRFLTMTDGVGQRTGEQLPLFAGFGRATGRPVTEVWGFLGYGIPLLPFALLWWMPADKRAYGWVLAAWCAWFGALAVVQRRYGNDFGPAAAVGFAWVIALLGRRAVSFAFSGSGRGRLFAAVLSVAIALVALSPPLVGQVWPRLTSGIREHQRPPSGRDPALRSVSGTLTRFMEQIRAVTPETSGYFDTRLEPEYGVAAHANFGHAIQNVARRPTPADPFWAFIGIDNWEAVFGLLGAPNESAAWAAATKLDARYVMTFSSARPETAEGWLHHADGRAVGPWSASQHFRLVTESASGGAHFAQVFQVKGRRGDARKQTPYKLFEVVDGAVLDVPAAPGSDVTATLRLRRPEGREFTFEWKAAAGRDGRARLRVPYPTGPGKSNTVVSLGPYRVRVGAETYALRVSEDDVRSGARVSL